MVTGGLGFIGSNLARRLVDLGADVLVVDALIPDCGGDPYNIAGIESRLEVRIADLRDAMSTNVLVEDREVIFNLAGQVSHVDSIGNPRADLDINCQSHLSLLEACRHRNPGATVVYASTRHVYGKPDTLPVTESHVLRPLDVNGINKAAGEAYHLVYSRLYGLKTVSLRLTNIYGPRQLIRHNRQGFIGWFVGQAVRHEEIPVYGDGTQRRDLIYVDDAADAFLRVGADAACDGEVYNVGGGDPICHGDLAALLVEVAGGGRVRFVEWPDERKAIDVGSVYVDSTKLCRRTGWTPTVRLRDGLARTVGFYREHLGKYLMEPVRIGENR
jgi:UDP-glucose 4-epimerase